MAEDKYTDSLPIGTVLKSPVTSYRIEDVLGKGGFGITYKASTRVAVGNVNVKVYFAIKEHFITGSNERVSGAEGVTCSAPLRERVENSKKDFIAEARRLYEVGAIMRNIVKVNEVFEANNTAYYVMEFIDGQSLRQYVKENGPLSVKQMKDILDPIMDAISQLHGRQMTHLDIKPDNIMLSTDDAGNIKGILIDFGLSKHYNEDGSPTSTINILGCSDGYSPIEQYAGITTFSPWADIYALGATMMYCLTGKTPKKSIDLRDDEVKKTLDPIAPEVAAAISHAMAKDRYARTQSVDDLRKELDGAPVASAKKQNVAVNADKTVVIGNDAPQAANVASSAQSVTPGNNYAESEERTSYQPSPQPEPNSGGSKSMIYVVIAIIGAVAVGLLIYFLTKKDNSGSSYNYDYDYYGDSASVYDNYYYEGDYGATPSGEENYYNNYDSYYESPESYESYDSYDYYDEPAPAEEYYGYDDDYVY